MERQRFTLLNFYTKQYGEDGASTLVFTVIMLVVFGGIFLNNNQLSHSSLTNAKSMKIQSEKDVIYTYLMENTDCTRTLLACASSPSGPINIYRNNLTAAFIPSTGQKLGDPTFYGYCNAGLNGVVLRAVHLDQANNIVPDSQTKQVIGLSHSNSIVHPNDPQICTDSTSNLTTKEIIHIYQNQATPQNVAGSVAWVQVNFDTYIKGGTGNPGNQIVVPVSGYYQIRFLGRGWHGSSGSASHRFVVKIDGAAIGETGGDGDDDRYMLEEVTLYRPLTANQVITVDFSPKGDSHDIEHAELVITQIQ